MANFISYFGLISMSEKTQISPYAEVNMVQIKFRVQVDTVETSYTHKNTGGEKHRLGLITTSQTSVFKH